jgi:hypothetical protein
MLETIRPTKRAKMFDLAVDPAPILLDFKMEKQEKDNWCWAATAKSVSHFYKHDSSWTQCRIAQQAFPDKHCPCAAPDSCDKQWYLEHALSTTSNFSCYTDPLTFDAIENELEGGRVIGARTEWIDWGVRRGHFVVIYGCWRTAAGGKYLKIRDPFYVESESDIAGFSTSYRTSGKWTHSYLTNP